MTLRLGIALLVMTLAPFALADEPEPPLDVEEEEIQVEPAPDESADELPAPGNAQRTQRANDQFVPTEQLRYDQEVDYPTDI